MASMLEGSALSIPQSGPNRSPLVVALVDVIAGLQATHIWGRLGWRATKLRYRRTMFGPFWSTLSLATFVIALGLIWSNLWSRNPKDYLPFLTSGMVCWVLFSTICVESCSGFISYETLIKQVRISYTLLACIGVWRNVVIFFHNLCVYLLVCVFAGVSVSWAMLLAIPGLALFCLNCVWIAILLGAVCARYRDLQQLIVNLLQLSLFLTPIFWSPDQLKGRAVILAQYNPLYHLIAVVRDPLLGKFPAALHWIVVVAMAVVGWALAIAMLNKLRHRIVYWL